MIKTILILLTLAAGALPAQQRPEFSLAISANGKGQPIVFRDEPLLVEVLLVMESGEAGVIALKGARPWTEALALKLTGPDGQIVQPEWTRLGGAAVQLTFTPEASEVRTILVLSPEAARALAAGDYELSISFAAEEAASPDAWTGRLPAAVLKFKVSPDPREDTPEARVSRQRLLARWHQLSGRPEDALSALELALEASPDDVHALSDKAGVLVELDRTGEAMAAVEKAISAFRKQNPKATHPPRELLRQRAALELL